MTGKIHILSELLMKRIAAGEVIERPASVVKELLENAIDAESTQISLYIRESGTGLIQVVDNGAGMSEDDALICTKRHATSKITAPDDLDEIHTLGFRGEALASIGSVSRMTVITRQESDTEATQAYIEDGKIQDVQKVAFNPGTSISVKDLFYNVPARRKFLKSATTELRHIMVAFRKIALAYPDIHFILYIDDIKTSNLPAGTLRERIRDLLGPEKMINFIEFEKQVGSLSLKGYVSRPGTLRKTRDDQFFFLNHRCITHRSLVHSVMSAFGPRPGDGLYPSYLIYIKMSPSFYDVNVHPAKQEVRFADEKFIHDVLHRSVKESLNSPQGIPDLHLVHGRKPDGFTFPPTKQLLNQLAGQMSLEVQRTVTVNPELPQSSSMEPAVFWQIHKKYILTQIKSGVTLIDQHAAHERILYEWALASKAKTGLSQQLLFPETVALSPDDYAMLVEILPYLEQIGFGIREFGNRTTIIEAVPVEIKPGHERELLQEMLDEYRENQDKSRDMIERVAAAFACRAAIKSGETLTQFEMASLIDRLFATSDPYTCPHGRPVVVNLTLEEIDKRFGRI
ncbi:DNA mismatch repair endonuclease MutL [candidate division KSB1 bacterium]|nr:DNA mismatch repair endonuclease MutL [candidate division KSB1 bacterium]